MNYLFVHQNFPGQFLHVARALARQPQHRVVCLGDAANLKDRPLAHPNIELHGYQLPQPTAEGTHHYLTGFDAQIRRGQHVVQTVLGLKKKGFEPDVVVAHPGWGEALFLRDAFPQAKHIQYFEFFYKSQGSDVNFDPEFSSRFDDELKLRIRNSAQLHALQACDMGVSPTLWQRRQYPPEFATKIEVLHEGVDTVTVCPKPDATLQLGALVFKAGDEIITYVARNLEPYRGFHVLMRSLPKLLAERPKAHVLVVGGDDVSYGRRLPLGQSYRAMYCQEIQNDVDWSRVHFLGKLHYRHYLQVLQVSAVHVYLTYPFVLSWSLLEAMSAGCAVVASNTAPVAEVIEDRQQGLLFDFFDIDAMVSQVCEVLTYPKRFTTMRQQARQAIVKRFDLQTMCLPQWLAMMR
jgi:glycosyltransferase involved in cell wall biosynthesis